MGRSRLYVKLLSWGVFESVENIALSKFKSLRSKLSAGCNGVTGRGGGETILGRALMLLPFIDNTVYLICSLRWGGGTGKGGFALFAGTYWEVVGVIPGDEIGGPAWIGGVPGRMFEGMFGGMPDWKLCGMFDGMLGKELPELFIGTRDGLVCVMFISSIVLFITVGIIGGWANPGVPGLESCLTVVTYLCSYWEGKGWGGPGSGMLADVLSTVWIVVWLGFIIGTLVGLIENGSAGGTLGYLCPMTLFGPSSTCLITLGFGPNIGLLL